MSTASTEDRTPILLVTDEMEVGGTQRQIVNLALGLDRRVFEVTVAYFRNPSILIDELRVAGIRVVEVAKRGRVDPFFVLQLAKLIREGRFAVVHAFAFSGELWAAAARCLIAPSRRPALITSVRGVYEWYRPWQWRVKRWVSRGSWRVVANSRAGAEYACRRLGLPHGAIDVIYNGVTLPAAQEAAAVRDETGCGAQSVMALFVGRLIDHKNLPVLLRAMALLRDELPPLKLAIAGDGPLRQDTERQIAQLQLSDSVRMLGERDDVPRLLAAADFLVLPSYREGLSNALLEAMHAGKPSVASAVGGNVELIEPGLTGLLFRSDDERDLAGAMRSLALDPGLRARIGAAAREAAQQRFSVAAMVREFELRYRQCVAEKASAARDLQPSAERRHAR